MSDSSVEMNTLNYRSNSFNEHMEDGKDTDICPGSPLAETVRTRKHPNIGRGETVDLPIRATKPGLKTEDGD
jgi:hypothetical protein